MVGLWLFIIHNLVGYQWPLTNHWKWSLHTIYIYIYTQWPLIPTCHHPLNLALNPTKIRTKSARGRPVLLSITTWKKRIKKHQVALVDANVLQIVYGCFSQFPFFALYAEVASPPKFWQKCNTHRFYRTSPSLKIVNLTFYLKIIPTESSWIPSSSLSGMICHSGEPPIAQKESTEIILYHYPVLVHVVAWKIDVLKPPARIVWPSNYPWN